MTRTIYRIETRRQGLRTRTGQYAKRHEEPRLVEITAKDPEDARNELALHVGQAMLGVKGSAPVDRIVIERVGVLA